MEIHAHVPQMGKSATHWLLEGLFIVLSVGLAFGVGQCREARENRELAARALRSLQDEIDFNVKAVEPYVDMHRTWAAALLKSVDGAEGNTAVEVYARTRPPFPAGTHAEFPLEVRRGAWDALRCQLVRCASSTTISSRRSRTSIRFKASTLTASIGSWPL